MPIQRLLAALAAALRTATGGPRRLGALATVLALALSATALAHGAGIGALLNLDPPLPGPGQEATIQVELRDALNNPIAGFRVLATVRGQGQPPRDLAELKETAPGTYRGTLRFPQAPQAVLRVEAHLPDGPWAGELPVSPGGGGFPLRNVGLVLAHEESPPEAATPARWWLGVIPLGLLAAGFYIFLRGERGGS